MIDKTMIVTRHVRGSSGVVRRRVRGGGGVIGRSHGGGVNIDSIVVIASPLILHLIVHRVDVITSSPLIQ